MLAIKVTNISDQPISYGYDDNFTAIEQRQLAPGKHGWVGSVRLSWSLFHGVVCLGHYRGERTGQAPIIYLHPDTLDQLSISFADAPAGNETSYSSRTQPNQPDCSVTDCTQPPLTSFVLYATHGATTGASLNSQTYCEQHYHQLAALIDQLNNIEKSETLKS